MLTSSILKVYRVGILNISSPSATTHLHKAFELGLREHGYIDGQNITLERRSAEGKIDRLPELAAELVRLRSLRRHLSTWSTAKVRRRTQKVQVFADWAASVLIRYVERQSGNDL